MKLFAAAFVPKEITENIYEYSKPAAEYFYAKAVLPENMHITLKFFGDKKTDNCLRIIENSTRNIKRFEVAVKNVDFFSYGKYAGVLWTGILDESLSLNKIALNIDNHKKDYVPHITLARFKNDSVKNSALDKHLSEVFLRKKEFGKFVISTISLVESVLDSNGAQYRIIKEFTLG